MGANFEHKIIEALIDILWFHTKIGKGTQKPSLTTTATTVIVQETPLLGALAFYWRLKMFQDAVSCQPVFPQERMYHRVFHYGWWLTPVHQNRGDSLPYSNKISSIWLATFGRVPNLLFRSPVAVGDMPMSG